MKNRKILLIVSVLLMIFMLALPAAAHGDAGNFAGGSDWDFDFGGSSGWDSSWDSDWDDDSDDYFFGGPVIIGNGFGGGGGGGSIVFVIVIVVAIVILTNLRKRKKGSSGGAHRPMRAADNTSIQRLLQQDPNFSIQKFTEDAANLYVRLQNAWQEKDLSPVRSEMTDNLYAQFERQLQPYISSGQTNHVENIAVLRTDLMSYRQDAVNDILTVDLHTRIVDYVTDDKTGKIIRGSASKELYMGYEYTFVRTKGVKTGQTVDQASTCPNCGAPLDINHSGKCEYCGSVLNRAEYTWALTAVKGLYQRS